MNISSAASFQTPYPQIAKASMEKNLTEKIEGPVIDEGRVMLTIEKLRAEWKLHINIEDLDELEEFLKKPDLDKKFDSLHSEIKSFKSLMIWGKEARAGDMLLDMEVMYSELKQNLRNKWSVLADKVTGFTLGEDGLLKVTSPPNTLDEWESNILNALLNENKALVSVTLKHATTVIELVQLDKKQFADKVTLNLGNFHKFIDYGLLLNKGALSLHAPDSWLDQLHKNADMEQREKKQGFHVEA
ncbi:hypothetical protein NYP20_22445 [Pseudomonas sp. N3-W]|uniref:hypothetical protein n=1 Tax=Pseudomonas sp. N3-W TaxID=2975049 RepID=UPI00217CE25B|nr:hypothetical protein [Pseudomonas sp. N3-W]UWF48044.1 hypothetical protein NYP20_22445 [Pseudomonas sp. N3-W]